MTTEYAVLFYTVVVCGNATMKIFLIGKRVLKELKFKYRLKVLFVFLSWLRRPRKENPKLIFATLSERHQNIEEKPQFVAGQ